MMQTDVAIVGAGLAGLCCARRLQSEGIACTVIEASDAVGGRIRTDREEGFLLDRGFQVLLTAYPECRRVLDYEALDLRPFLAGSVIRHGGRFHRLSDPWRQPTRALESLLSSVGSLGDKLRVARLRASLRRRDIESLFAEPDSTTLERLRSEGFSERMIQRFFRPFLGGVFLDPDLETTSRMFRFVFKMFSEGAVAVPNLGMQAIPESIAAAFEDGSVLLGNRIVNIDGTKCRFESGAILKAMRVVVATDGSDAAPLMPGLPEPRWRGTVCLYFDAPEPPRDEAVLILDGDGNGPVNSVCTMSRVAPGYAPEGRSLVSASVIGDPSQDLEGLERAVRSQLKEWFGSVVDDWRALRHYRVPRALPHHPAASRVAAARETGVVACGDHLENASIHGAMLSGRKAAETVIASWQRDGT